MPTIRQDSYGQTLEIKVVDDLGKGVDYSDATTSQILLRDPKGKVTTRTLTPQTTGSDGIFEYVSQSGDFPISGPWKVQARFAKTGMDIPTDTADLTVVGGVT